MTESIYIGTRYKTTKSCLKDIKLGVLMGEGNFGQVYDACNPDCKYVLKVMALPIEFGNDFDTEVEITKKAGNLGIGPKFIDAWTCEAEDQHGALSIGLILTEKYEKTLAAYLKEYKKMDSNTTIVLMKLIEKMHKNNIIHCDLKPGNIVVDTNGDREIIRIAIIDYGLSFSKDNIPDDISGRFAHSMSTSTVKIQSNVNDMPEIIEYIDFQWLSRK